MSDKAEAVVCGLGTIWVQGCDRVVRDIYVDILYWLDNSIYKLIYGVQTRGLSSHTVR